MAFTKTYKAVFIDLDDTIWDFHTNARLSLELVFHRHNLLQYFDSFDSFFRIYAKRNLELWDEYGKGEVTKEFLMTERFRYPLATAGLNDVTLAEQIGIEFLDKLPEQTSLMPHALEVLDYLHSKYPLTLISNGFVEVQYRKMRSSGIESYFTHLVLSESAAALKPDKAIFEYALQLNNVEAHEAIMIGDSYAADIAGAQNAGIDQIYYPQSYPEKPGDYNCTHLIHSLKEITTIL